MLVMPECLSPVVCLVCRQQNGSAQLLQLTSPSGDTRNAKSAAALVFNGEADLWRDQETWVTAQSFRKSKQILIKPKKEYGITDVDTSDRGEWGHASKEDSGPSSRQIETPKCTKKLHHKPLYVPGTFIPGEISPGVKVPRTPPALLSSGHSWFLGAWTISVLYSRVLDSRIRTKICICSPCCNSAGKERDSHPRIIFPASLFTRVPDPRLVRNDVLCFAMFHADVSGS